MNSLESIRHLRETLHFAGFFAAHGVLSVSEGETLIPILGSEDFGGGKILTRIDSEEYKDAVAEGRLMLEDNPERSERLVFVFDGFINLPSGRTDALIVEARSYFIYLCRFTMAIPYRPATRPDGFAVHRPKLYAWHASEPFEEVAQSFQDGIDSHLQASDVWDRHIDQSI